MNPHQYIDRDTLSVRNESLYCDRLIQFLYSDIREHAPSIFRLLTGKRACRLLGFLTFEQFFSRKVLGVKRFIGDLAIDLSECLEPEQLTTPKKIFERRIKFWECRPMEDADEAVASPADARMVVGSLSKTSALFIKNKFFDTAELLGIDRLHWLKTFENGDFAIFRLTPDKYHFNHVPVTGRVVDFYAVEGRYHSCNPSASVSQVNALSKNRRVVTIMDTDVKGGTGVGLVAMIEIVALAIGRIEQCYSDSGYEHPKGIAPGMTLSKGCPKSLFHPGSSTDVLIFEKGRVCFSQDLIENMGRPDVQNRFGLFGHPFVEIDVKVRSTVARRTSPQERTDRTRIIKSPAAPNGVMGGETSG